MQIHANGREFHPELLSRKGEMIAWGSALLVGLAWLVVGLKGQPVILAVPILTVLLVLSGLSISLGNWMDRHTLISIREDGITFKNGLRNGVLKWQEIRQVRVLPVHWGKKVQVFGEKVYFEFRTLGEVKVQGELKGRMGFAKGDEILRQIVLSGNLHIVDQVGEGYYYARD
jgi:hypothetical protein